MNEVLPIGVLVTMPFGGNALRAPQECRGRRGVIQNFSTTRILKTTTSMYGNCRIGGMRQMIASRVESIRDPLSERDGYLLNVHTCKILVTLLHALIAAPSPGAR
jgi:hypothetical protein